MKAVARLSSLYTINPEGIIVFVLIHTKYKDAQLQDKIKHRLRCLEEKTGEGCGVDGKKELDISLSTRYGILGSRCSADCPVHRRKDNLLIEGDAEEPLAS